MSLGSEKFIYDSPVSELDLILTSALVWLTTNFPLFTFISSLEEISPAKVAF